MPAAAKKLLKNAQINPWAVAVWRAGRDSLHDICHVWSLGMLLDAYDILEAERLIEEANRPKKKGKDAR